MSQNLDSQYNYSQNGTEEGSSNASLSNGQQRTQLGINNPLWNHLDREYVNGQMYLSCKHCPQKRYKITTGPTTIKDHLNKHHNFIL